MDTLYFPHSICVGLKQIAFTALSCMAPRSICFELDKKYVEFIRFFFCKRVQALGFGKTFHIYHSTEERPSHFDLKIQGVPLSFLVVSNFKTVGQGT